MNELAMLSWNVEHFNGQGGVDKKNREKRQNRVHDVITLVKDACVDVFCLSEVVGTDVHQESPRVVCSNYCNDRKRSPKEASSIISCPRRLFADLWRCRTAKC